MKTQWYIWRKRFRSWWRKKKTSFSQFNRACSILWLIWSIWLTVKMQSNLSFNIFAFWGAQLLQRILLRCQSCSLGLRLNERLFRFLQQLRNWIGRESNHEGRNSIGSFARAWNSRNKSIRKFSQFCQKSEKPST